jgi:hypothetical protein
MTADTYRVLVTGSREWDDAQELRLALIHATALRLDSVIIVHGACPTGADALAAEWAQDYGVTPEPHPADWDAYGKAAGPRRNAEMVALGADLCLAFFKRGAGNRGTSDCASQALAAGIPVRRVTS